MWAIAAVTWSDDVRLHAPGFGHGDSFPVSEPRGHDRPAAPEPPLAPATSARRTQAWPGASGQSSVGRSRVKLRDCHPLAQRADENDPHDGEDNDADQRAEPPRVRVRAAAFAVGPDARHRRSRESQAA